jgi:hypothetical protein
MRFTGKLGSARSLLGRIVLGRDEPEEAPAPPPALSIEATARPALSLEPSVSVLGMTATARPALSLVATEQPV